MAYQALYRQWRPATFSEMVGQEHIITALRNQVMTGRIAHAYLFCGSRGTGKTSTAKIMARAVNCLRPVNGDPCGECENCRTLLEDGSLDVVEIDAASNSRVEEARELLESVKYPPQYGKRKVYIVDEVHMLSTSAFNALLKTLEEPPAYVVFILATTDPQKLPATILSRCQRFDFSRIPAEQIAGRLREAVDAGGFEADDSALTLLARAAEGGMRDALSLLDMCLGYGRRVDTALVHEVLGTSDRSFLFRFSEHLQREDAANLLQMIDDLTRRGREPVVFARDVAAHLRALLLAKTCPDEAAGLLEVTAEDAADYVRQAEGFTETRLLSMMELFMDVEGSLRYAASPRACLETAALKACLRTGEEDAAALRQRVEALEEALRSLNERLASGQAVVAAPEAKKQPAPKAAQPQEAVPGVMTPTGRSSDDAWKDMMSALGKTQPGLQVILKLGKYAGCTEQTWRWIAPQASYAKKMNGEKERGLICGLLQEATGLECRFEAVTKEELPKAGGDESMSFLDPLYETFSRETVVVQ